MRTWQGSRRTRASSGSWRRSCARSSLCEQPGRSTMSIHYV
jgi:hypothetical protein